VIYVLKGGDVHRTANGGGSWTNVKGSISGTPVSVAVAANNPDDVWVTTSGYTATAKVWRSTNGGVNWSNQTLTGLPNLPCNAIVLDNIAGGVYVGMDIGVYHRKINQAAWEPFIGGLPNASIRELDISQKGTGTSDRRILAATFGRGVWRSRLWDDIAPVAARTVPVLRQFNATVANRTLRLRFLVGEDRDEDRVATVRLTAADGSLLHEERVRSFGIYEREINLGRSGAGVYFFTLSRDAAQVSRRIAVY
jgi:hypothetical protein